MITDENAAHVTPSRLSRTGGQHSELSTLNVTKEIAGVSHRDELLSLYLPDLLYVSRARVTFVTFTALKAARAPLAVNNRKAANAFSEWLKARPEFQDDWPRAKDILWRRRKSLRRQQRAARSAQ